MVWYRLDFTSSAAVFPHVSSELKQVGCTQSFRQNRKEIMKFAQMFWGFHIERTLSLEARQTVSITHFIFLHKHHSIFSTNVYITLSNLQCTEHHLALLYPLTGLSSTLTLFFGTFCRRMSNSGTRRHRPLHHAAE